MLLFVLRSWLAGQAGQAGGLKKASNFIFKMALYMFSIIYKCTQRRKGRNTRAGYNKHEMCCGGNIFEATLSTLRKKGIQQKWEGREKGAGQEQDIDGSIAVVIRRLFSLRVY